jgi:hypothetical protein
LRIFKYFINQYFLPNLKYLSDSGQLNVFNYDNIKDNKIDKNENINNNNDDNNDDNNDKMRIIIINNT